MGEGLVFLTKAGVRTARARWRTFLLLSMLAAPLFPAAPPPALYFYPPEYRYRDGHILNSPQTIAADKITTQFPFIPEMSGVVLMVYWSTLSPDGPRLDLSLIDEVIAYWGTRGKKVILNVATIGFPIASIPDGVGITGATPDWVMKQVRTYELPGVKLLGRLPFGTTTNAVLPDFRDSKFLDLQLPLIRRLAEKYDGHPAVSEIRIALGAMGEENPIVGPLVKPLAGYREREWLDYCQRVTEVYLAIFKKSVLEVGLSRLPWVRARGSIEEANAIDAYVGFLLSNKIFLTFNGLEHVDIDLLKEKNPTNNGIVHSLRYLIDYKSRGGSIGLEAYGNLVNPRMGTKDLANVYRISAAVREIAPDRLVFFPDVAKAILAGSTNDPHHAYELLRDLGYLR